MKNIFKIVVAFALVLLVFSCSTKKNSFINRKYHSIATEFNVLYNGELALDDGLEALNAYYEDNFWEILPVEPLKIDELALPGMQREMDNSPQEFERAEEKAVKAIQKHSMLIARKERNSQIDAAYLLLGKARYYSKRFVPAIEAFNYILINYPSADLIDETRVWQAKTNIRLQNEDMAIESLSFLLDNISLKDKVKEDANTAMAMAYAKMDSINQVIRYLKQAVLTNNNKEQTARNLFILGQLYRDENKIDSSNIAFQKIIDLKNAPYKYVIHAHIEQAKNVSNKVAALAMSDELQILIEDRYNRPYLDELYYRLAALTLRNNEDMALVFYKKSIQASERNNFQKELTYEAIGNISFDKAKYSVAGAYYDSVLQITTNENTKRIRSLKRKRNNLEEVIVYEGIAKRNDSILDVVGLSSDDRLTFFTNYIETLKAEEERKRELEEIMKVNSGINLLGSNNNNTISGGKWYFYNTQAVQYGEQEFRNIWGNRPLEDNWRLSEKMRINMNSLGADNTVVTQEDKSKKYELSYYLEKIPSNPVVIDSISEERNDAYYKLGIIYQAQFKEIDLAISRLEKLLTFNPGIYLSLPAKYHLYKMYAVLNNKKAEDYKNDLTVNYPESKYSKIILNPTDVLITDESNSSSETEYANLYYEYKEEEYDSVIEKSTNAILKYEGQFIVSKFELLKAYAIGKRDGMMAFKEELDLIVANYPNTAEGKKALEVLQTINSKI